ncbi:unnamed protein product [Leuciscus chuanchicus]
MEQSVTNKFMVDTIQQLKAEMLSHFDVKMDYIQTSLTSIQGSLTTLGDHVSELENRVSSNEDNVTDIQSRLKLLEGENSYLRDKLDDVENRSRAYNLRFLHVPEKAEGINIHGSSAAYLSSFWDKSKILRLARGKKELKYNDKRVHIYPDFSASLLQKRREFDDIKKKLRELDMEYSLHYPATLKIISYGKSVLCKTPGEAEQFLHELQVLPE